MNEAQWAARLLLLLHDMMRGTTTTARSVLKWAGENRDLVPWDRPTGQAAKAARRRSPRWDDLSLATTATVGSQKPNPMLVTGRLVASVLELEQFDSDLLLASIALERLPRIASLRTTLLRAKQDMAMLYGRLAGADAASAAQRVRRSLVVRLGLLEVDRDSVLLTWTFGKLLDRGVTDEEDLVEGLVGPRHRTLLSPTDFGEHGGALDFAARLIGGALRKQSPGINLLLHGPPGTGKTEAAKALALAAGARLFAVGEVDEDGDEPNRFVRLHALRRGQRLLARRSDSVLLFDEMEDLFDTYGRGSTQQRSKVFVNRLLETNAVPTIWISNSIEDVDRAHLRRMSFILKMNHPSPRNRTQLIATIANDEGHDGEALAQLAADHPETASIARVVLRAASIAGAQEGEAERVAASLLVALRGGSALKPVTGSRELDLGLFESEPSVAHMVESLGSADAPADFSLLLTGPPGTGKTGLAQHIAATLDRPLLVKRASDLLSKWVGETEANIAGSFAQARNEHAVLLFDEVDSLLFDRAGARTSWEVTQVNELLTWMDDHDLPFIAATNHPRRLDPAAMRRFDFKLVLQTLSAPVAGRAFARFFGHKAPEELARLRGLTPGDFAVVSRQLRFQPVAEVAGLVRLLEREVESRTNGAGRIGF